MIRNAISCIIPTTNTCQRNPLMKELVLYVVHYCGLIKIIFFNNLSITASRYWNNIYIYCSAISYIFIIIHAVYTTRLTLRKICSFPTVYTYACHKIFRLNRDYFCRLHDPVALRQRNSRTIKFKVYRLYDVNPTQPLWPTSHYIHCP
jgi:hypothetical protein